MKTIRSSSALLLLFLAVPCIAMAQGWHIETVDSEGDVGRYTSIAVDSADHPHISYRDWTNGGLKYATNAEIPIGANVSDFDADGNTDIAIYRRSTGGWWVIPSSTGSPYGVGWGGLSGDMPVNPTVIHLY